MHVPPPDPSNLFHLAEAAFLAGDLHEAEALCRKALAESPQAGLPSIRHLLRVILQRLGRFDEAVASLEESLARDPKRIRPYIDLVSVRKTTDAHRPLLERMSSMLQDRTLTNEDRRNIHYALGKAYDDLGEFRKAMQHFDEANGMMLIELSATPFVREKQVAGFDRMINTFSKKYLSDHRDIGTNTERPIFIVGMIRSGTTLVDQILSSHPDIGAAGELTLLLSRYRSVIEPVEGAPHHDEAAKLASDYLHLLESKGGDRPHITDKQPNNFTLLGLIYMIFPNARIIHCRRNPVDTCISIYSTPFPSPIQFAHDPDVMVFFYKEYLRIMDHWRKVIPFDRLLEVNYEDLVNDREKLTREMVDFCGLKWDDACLYHEQNARAIDTPSWWQARQPVYTSSIGRWQNYEPWLGSFRELMPTLPR